MPSSRTVLVCEAQVPFVHGGAELHVRGLVNELTRRGYRAERVSVLISESNEAHIADLLARSYRIERGTVNAL